MKSPSTWLSTMWPGTSTRRRNRPLANGDIGCRYERTFWIPRRVIQLARRMGGAQRYPSCHHAHETSRWVSQALNPSYGLRLLTQVICPSGTVCDFAFGLLSSLFQKIFLFFRNANQGYISPVPSHSRGGSRSSRTRGGMQWTRGGASDEGAILRTAKSCGPDAPTLASSLWG